MNLYLKRAQKYVLISCLMFMGTALFAQNAERITIKNSNITLKKALTEVEKQSKMSVAYNESQLANKSVSLDIENQSLENALSIILKNTGFTYQIKNGCIVVVPIQKETSIKSKKITGKVVDETGESLIGVNVSVAGSATGTITDFDGNFTLDVAAGATLKISYVGYKSQSVKVSDLNYYNITMASDNEVLDEVVVTALGIKKEAKALSYNVQEVSAREIIGVKDANFVNSLSGKIAGVSINTSSSGIGGGAKVVMRGAKSISGNNNALYVIDGVPMPTLDTTQPDDQFTGMGQSGDGASMINPEDIETMSVLSGAAASALYGSDAANGVIMITTKKGTANKLNVSYANNTSFYNPFVTPEFQNTYGAATGSFQSWGQKLAQPSTYDPLDFFQTGWNETNSVTLSNGNEKNQTFVSLASTNAEGIVQNNTYDRYNFSVRNTTSMLNDKMHLDLSANYVNIREQNMVSQGQYFNPIVPVYLMSPSYSLETYQLFEMYDESRGFKTQYWPWGNMGLAMQNPYWIINRDKFVNSKNRFLVSGGLTYDIAKGITISGRTKFDYTSAISEKKYSASTDAIFAQQY